MKKRIITAAIVTPIACAAAGVMIARSAADASDAQGYCVEPTMYVDIAGGVSLVSGGVEGNVSCDGPSCSVAGAEQVEVSADGQVQCVNVNAGQTMSLTWRDGALVVEEVAAP